MAFFPARYTMSLAGMLLALLLASLPVQATPLLLADGDLRDVVVIPDASPASESLAPPEHLANAGEPAANPDMAADASATQDAAKNSTLQETDLANASAPVASVRAEVQPLPTSTPAPANMPAPGSAETVQAPPATSQNGTMTLPTQGWQSYFRALGGLFLILAVVLVGLYFLRRVLPRAGLGGGKARQLVLESTLPLGPRKSLMVVRFLNKQLVLGVTDTRITCLHIQEDDHVPDETSDNTTATEGVLSSFASRLKDHS